MSQLEKIKFELASYEQKQKIEEGEDYLRSNRIQELFDEVLAKMVLEKPQQPREWLIQELSRIKDKKYNRLLSDEDFESIFSNYNILNKDWIPSRFLPQSLGLCGINNAEQLAGEKYSELLEVKRISKDKFLKILKMEYKLHGFC